MKIFFTTCLMAVAMAFSFNAMAQDAALTEKEQAQEQAPLNNDPVLQVNINQADAKQLSQLKNIGLKKAQSIVLYREQNGPFANLEDLKKVKGIGKGIIEKNRAHIVIAQQ